MVVAWTDKEEKMPTPLPIELRQRAVDSYKAGDGTQEEIAERFKVGVASLGRWLALEKETGSLAPKPASGNRTQQKLFEEHIQALIKWLELEPDLIMSELADKIKQDYQITIDPSQISRLLVQRGITRKKK